MNGRIIVVVILLGVALAATLAVTHRDLLGWDRRVGTTIHAPR